MGSRNPNKSLEGIETIFEYIEGKTLVGVEILINPWKGLKQKSDGLKNARLGRVEILINPWKGLKQTLSEIKTDPRLT